MSTLNDFVHQWVQHHWKRQATSFREDDIPRPRVRNIQTGSTGLLIGVIVAIPGDCDGTEEERGEFQVHESRVLKIANPIVRRSKLSGPHYYSLVNICILLSQQAWSHVRSHILSSPRDWSYINHWHQCCCCQVASSINSNRLVYYE